MAKKKSISSTLLRVKKKVEKTAKQAKTTAVKQSGGSTKKTTTKKKPNTKKLDSYQNKLNKNKPQSFNYFNRSKNSYAQYRKDNPLQKKSATNKMTSTQKAFNQYKKYGSNLATGNNMKNAKVREYRSKYEKATKEALRSQGMSRKDINKYLNSDDYKKQRKAFWNDTYKGYKDNKKTTTKKANSKGKTIAELSKEAYKKSKKSGSMLAAGKVTGVDALIKKNANNNAAKAMVKNENKKRAVADTVASVKTAVDYRTSKKYVQDYRKMYKDSVKKQLKDMGATKEQISDYLKSDEYKQARKEFYKEHYTKENGVGTIAKGVKSSIRSERSKMAKEDANTMNELISNPLTDSDYKKMTTGAMKGQLSATIKTDKGLKSRVTKANVRGYTGANVGAQGFLDQVNMGLSVSDDPTYKYTDSQKRIMERGKERGAYKLGRLAGGVAEFAAPGMMGSSLVKNAGKVVGKEALKAAAETGGKQFAKTTAKNIAWETAADAATSMPFNALDAIKDSYKNGKLDRNEFVKSLALNEAGDILLGGAISGLTHGLSAKQVSKFNKILGKVNSGVPISSLPKSESKFFLKHADEILNKVESKATAEQVIKNESGGGAKRIESAEYKEQLNRAKDIRARISEIAEKGGKATKQDIDEVEGLMEELNKIVDSLPEKANTVDNAVAKTDTETAEIKTNNAIEEPKIDVDNAINKVKENAETAAEEIKETVEPNAQAEPKTALESTTEPNTRTVKTEDSEAVNIASPENEYIGINHIELDEKANQIDNEISELEKRKTKAKTPEEVAEIDGRINELESELDKTEQAWFSGQPKFIKTVDNTSVKVDDTAKAEESTLSQENLDGINSKWEEADKAVNDYESRLKTEDMTVEELAREYDRNAKMADYKAEAERIIRENPDITQNAAKQKALYFDKNEELKAAFDEAIDKGFFKKEFVESQKQAMRDVEELAKTTSLRDMSIQFLGMDYMKDPHKFGAVAKYLLDELGNEFSETGSKETLELMLKVGDFASAEVSAVGRALNAAKMWVSMTPMGRVNAMERTMKRMSRQYGDRLEKSRIKEATARLRDKGKTDAEIKAYLKSDEFKNEQVFKLTEGQKAMLYGAKGDEAISKAVADIMRDTWDKIPSTMWEKVNTARHIGMLLNLRTNARNVGANGVFAGIRALSDAMEWFISSKIMRNTLIKNGSDAIMATSTKFTSKEKEASKDFIEKQFNDFYDANSSRWKDGIDTSRPIDKTVLESKLGSNVEKFTYWLLEKGDIAFFKPEYMKQYRRWCKTHMGEDALMNLDNMTKVQKAEANEFAMKMAERATFRETTALSKALSKLKDKTATKKGTWYGTVGYRAANALLEANIPFVKTPINVFRQSVDYSPVGLLKSAANMIEFARKGEVEMLEKAIHQMSTGLTGSGICLLGWFLASHDIVMVKAGEKSGDAYYDRDMGYQDYSLIIGGHSFTIDWMSPMQASLFMGAQLQHIADLKNMDSVQAVNALSSLLLPHLESSFMSSAADTLQMFVDTVNDRDNWGGAIIKTLGGSIPQSYISSLLPFTQLTTQISNVTDEYQRDTRSTEEDPLKNSWDTWKKRMMSRTPFLRTLLKPKLDRRGHEVKSLAADSLVGKVFLGMINPSTVKKITLDEKDKEIIDIYKHMPEGDDKDYYYFNFTAPGTYELEGIKKGKRMTYEESYEYIKSSRIAQDKAIDDMINAKSYKDMTYDMKAKEIESSHWIGKAKADWKTYGAKYACSALNRDADQKAWNNASYHGESADNFMKFYLGKEKLVARAHSSDYNTKALAVQKYGTKKIREAYDIYDSKMKAAKAYLKAGGSIKEYSNAMCSVMSILKKEGVSSDNLAGATVNTVKKVKAIAKGDNSPDISDRNSNKAVAAAYVNMKDRVYAAMGLTEQKANMGYWFKNNEGEKGNKYTLKTLAKLKADGELDYDLNTKKGVQAYIDSLGISSAVERACLFEYLDSHGSRNPYGNIPNYLELKDDGSAKSGGGGYRRGGRHYGRRGRRGHGSGGSGKGVDDWNAWVKDYLATAQPKSSSNNLGVTDNTRKSALDDAYRRKMQALLKK